VAAVDADLDRGSLHYRLDVPVGRGTFSLADVLDVLDDISDDVLANALSMCPSGAGLLPSPPAGRGALAPDSPDAARLIGALGRVFDLLVIDTPPAFDSFTAGLLSAADAVLLVAIPELCSLGGARRAVANLAAQSRGSPEIFFVLNRSLGSSDLISHEEIESLLGVRALRVLPEDGARCRRLSNECRSLATERSTLGREIDSLIRQVYEA
jgi:MinD-like ATPase involved in chromosome partitioning or flagellar assembly